MAAVKAALKAAKAAIDSQSWDGAINQANSILESDPNHHIALLILARAYGKLDKVEDSENALKKAAEVKPNDTQAWAGLIKLYEDQGSKKINGLIEASRRYASIVATGPNSDSDEAKYKCQSTIDNLTTFVKTQGTDLQYVDALKLTLPNTDDGEQNELYTYLEGRLPRPDHTYSIIADILLKEETKKINDEIGKRRTRLGATKATTTAEVKREYLGNSPIEALYEQIIDWTQDDAVRREYEEKLFRRALDTLLVLPSKDKQAKREKVMKMADGMVLIKHRMELAWVTKLEWADVANMAEYDVNVLREFIDFFPKNGLSKVLRAWLKTDLSPFPPPAPKPEQQSTESSDEDDEEGGVSLEGPENLLILMTEGITEARTSVLAHRLMADYYIHLEEFESAVETLRTGLKLLNNECRKSGLELQNIKDAMNSGLGTALVQYQSPRHHPEAKELFESILERKPTFTPALIGIGLILEDEQEYEDAIQFLTKVLERESSNVRIGAELAWCKALNGDYAQGKKELEQYLDMMDTRDLRSRDLRAETLWRIGTCLWNMDTSKASRKDRSRAYARWLSAMKTNPNYGPAYTSLGIFYNDFARDKRRARQCFQKAFELSASEVVAAEYLARSFAAESDWDIVELVAQRVVDSGKTRPAPGSKKKKGISWPYSALGVVQMNQQEYSKSIVSFLTALRIAPDDYHAWVGLGESYHNSGRYISAAKSFNWAENPEDGTQMKKTGEAWFTHYMLANVNRELGVFDAAVEGFKEVLEERPNEFGVSIALLQTLEERAWRCIEQGFYGRAGQSAAEAVHVASSIVTYRPETFNLWKSLGDACAIFSWVQGKHDEFPFAAAKKVLEANIDIDEYKLFADSDGIDGSFLQHLQVTEETDSIIKPLLIMLGAVLSHKRAIISCMHDIHAQAVAWYNLGWTLYRTSDILSGIATCPIPSMPTCQQLLKASLRALKRSIELEPSNSYFWHALGVTATSLNARVAQHAFVRSLHLNERSSKTWLALGVLYLKNNDFELAHQAFGRAQSNDPDYARAWIGEGIVAGLAGQADEAREHYFHAEAICNADEVVVKQVYSTSAFDRVVDDKDGKEIDVVDLVRPLFSLQQLFTLEPNNLPLLHLRALFLERIGAFEEAIEALEGICETAEKEYETTEAPSALAHFAMAKADIARSRLAAQQYSEAIEDSDTCLSLISESEDATEDGLTTSQRRNVSLSAHLTAGLAHYYLHKSDPSNGEAMDASIGMFRGALDVSSSAPDVVVVLASVLYAKGGASERTIARDQLLEAATAHPSHIGVRIRLGAMAAIDHDWDTCDAVRSDLLTLRAESQLSYAAVRSIEDVLELMASLEAAVEDSSSARLKTLREAQTALLLNPELPFAWQRIASLAEDPKAGARARETAKRVARKAVPPNGQLDANDLARAYAEGGSVADAQRAVVLAPWEAVGWGALAGAVEAR